MLCAIPFGGDDFRRMLFVHIMQRKEVTYHENFTQIHCSRPAVRTDAGLLCRLHLRPGRDALLEHSLVAGDESEYGLYVKVVNGMTADFDVDQAYWAFYKDGEMMNTGVDGATIADGEHYELVYTK